MTYCLGRVIPVAIDLPHVCKSEWLLSETYNMPLDNVVGLCRHFKLVVVTIIKVPSVQVMFKSYDDKIVLLATKKALHSFCDKLAESRQ